MSLNTQYRQDVNSPQIELKIQCSVSQNSNRVFFNWQAKIHQEMKRPRIVETILKKKSWKINTS